MLEIIKRALRITTDAFDAEIALLVVACVEEMASLGVIVEIYGKRYILDIDREYLVTMLQQKIYIDDEMALQIFDEQLPASPQVLQAIIAYCKWQFGFNGDAERWEAIYHEKLAQLKTMTGFTDWTPTEA